MYQEHGQLQGTVNIVLRSEDGRVKHHKTIKNKLMNFGLAHIVGRMIDTNQDSEGTDASGNVGHITPKMMRFMGIGTGKFDMTDDTQAFKGRVTKNIGYQIMQTGAGTSATFQKTEDAAGFRDVWSEGYNNSKITAFRTDSFAFKDISLAQPGDITSSAQATGVLTAGGIGTGEGYTVREGSEWRLENEVTVSEFAFTPTDANSSSNSSLSYVSTQADQYWVEGGTGARDRRTAGRIDMGNTQASDTVAPDGETVYYPATYAVAGASATRPGNGRNCAGHDSGDPYIGYTGSNGSYTPGAARQTAGSRPGYLDVTNGTPSAGGAGSGLNLSLNKGDFLRYDEGTTINLGTGSVDYAEFHSKKIYSFYRVIADVTATTNLTDTTFFQKLGTVTVNGTPGSDAATVSVNDYYSIGGFRSEVTEQYQGSIPSELSNRGAGKNTLDKDTAVSFMSFDGITPNAEGQGSAISAGQTTGHVPMFGDSSGDPDTTANKYLSTTDGMHLAGAAYNADQWPTNSTAGDTGGFVTQYKPGMTQITANINNTSAATDGTSFTAYTDTGTEKTGVWSKKGQTHYIKEGKRHDTGIAVEVPTFINKKRGDRLVFIALFPKDSPSTSAEIPVVEAGIFNHWDSRPFNADVGPTTGSGAYKRKDWTRGFKYPQTMLCRTTFSIVTKQPADSLQITWSIQFADATPDYWKQYAG